MDLANPIERDPDIGDIGRLQQRGFFRRDESAIGGNRQFQVGSGRFIHQIEESRMNQRLSA
ncbi:MAG: hypothetical protein WEB53_08480 [Akkermansiaceae bacterium]